MKFRTIYLLLLPLAFQIAGHAAEHAHSTLPDSTNTFSIDWVLGEMRANNPSLKAARANWQAAEQRVPQARAWEDPRAGVDVIAGRFVNVPQNSFSDQRLVVEQPVPLSGKNRLRGRAAKSEAIVASEDFRRRELDLTAKAHATYFRLGNAYAQLRINRRSTDILKRIAEHSRAKFEAGKETPADVLSAEIELARLEESAVDLERQISDEQSQLNTLMNNPPQSPLGRPVSEPFRRVSVAFGDAEAVAFAHRPELLSAQKKIETVRAKLQLAQREWIPDPSIRVEASRYNGASQPISEVMAGVSINLPWFNRKKYSSGVSENRRMLESAQYELESAKSETAAMIRDQLKKIETFAHHYELFRDKILPLAQQTVRTTEISEDESEKTASDQVSMAQRDAQQSESMLVQHLTDYQIALAELEAMVGIPLNEISSTPAKNNQEKK